MTTETATRRTELAQFPERMVAADVAEWMGISLNAFYKLEAVGKFTFAEHKPKIGKKSWSRERLRQWDAGKLAGLTGTKTLAIVPNRRRA